EVLNKHNKTPSVEKVLKTTSFKYALRDKKVMRLINKSIYLYQKSGLKRIVEESNILNVSPKYNALNKIMPDVILSKRISKSVNPFRQQTISVGFFQGCIMDAFFSRINRLAIDILRLHEVQVTNIPTQSCCGALQHHAGEKDITIKQAKENI